MTDKKFPDDFLWGTAISAFQVEMGRGEPSDKTDWWKWVTDPYTIEKKIVSGDNPNDGPGFWELYKEDFKLVKEELSSNAIRISIDWGRLFPESTKEIDVNPAYDEWGNVSGVQIDKKVLTELENHVNKDAVNRYRDILKSGHQEGLTVMLTMFHWPIPLWLHDPIACNKNLEETDKRGWLDNRTIIEFTKYAAYVAYSMGDIVDLYCTINEPRIISEHGYLSEKSEFPPGLYDPQLYLQVMKNLAIAHGLAYQQVKKWDKTSINQLGPATVGIVPVLQAFAPYDPEDPADIEASRLIDYAFNEWGLNAVIQGDYDMNLDYIIQPHEQWPHLVKGCDFLGVNYYSRWKIKHIPKTQHPLGNFKLMPCEGDCTDFGWEIYPEGLRQVLNWAYKRYRRPIYITENGIADEKGDTRTKYLLTHLEKLHQTIHQDKISIKGYFHWTLMDNFEWSDGYNIKFGLYHYDKTTKKRTPTKTTLIYQKISKTNQLPK